MPLTVDPPTTHRRESGLLAAADLRDTDDARMVLGGIEWVPEQGCAMPSEQGVACIDGPKAAKPFDGYDVVRAATFIAVKGQKCKPLFGADRDTARARARRGLKMGEATLVEKKFATSVLHTATDLGGGAARVQTALGLLEAHLWQNYGPRGIIYTDPVVLGHLLDSRLVRCDQLGGLSTCAGTPVAVGAYPSEPHPADRGWLYASGALLALRGPIVEAEADDTTTNEHVVLAERPWALGVECLLVKVEAQVPGNPEAT